MLGGMSGGGMGFIFDPRRKAEAQDYLQQEMSRAKRELRHALPFAMEPVVYDFAINDQGTSAELWTGGEALMPAGYYGSAGPALAAARAATAQSGRPRRDRPVRRRLPAARPPSWPASIDLLSPSQLFPASPRAEPRRRRASLRRLLEENGFDPELHEQIRADLSAAGSVWRRTACRRARSKTCCRATSPIARAAPLPSPLSPLPSLSAKPPWPAARWRW